jgi:hypothetical protein
MILNVFVGILQSYRLYLLNVVKAVIHIVIINLMLCKLSSSIIKANLFFLTFILKYNAIFFVVHTSHSL